MDIGFGDAQSFVCDVAENNNYVLLELNHIKKVLLEPYNFMKRMHLKICFYSMETQENSLKKQNIK